MRVLTLPLLLGLTLAIAACSGKSDDDTGDQTSGDDDDDNTGDDDDDAPVDCSTRPTDIPTARGEVGGGYSPAADQFIFFGGDEGVPNNCQSQTAFVDDTWVYEEDCGNWRQVTGGTTPDPTARYASAYDTARDQFVIHGGRFRDGTSGNYTLRRKAWGYAFTESGWSLLAEDGGPTVRAIHAGAIAGDQFIIHGGTGSKDGLSYNPIYNETWALDLTSNTWSELSTNGGPGGRIFHAMASDGANKVWLYGGGDENAFFGPFFSDVWELDLSNNMWTELHNGNAGAPDGRIGSEMQYDAANDRLLIWAGHDITDLGNNNQIHAFNLGSNSFDTIQEGDIVDAGANGFCDFPADFVEIEEGTPERRYLSASAMTDDGRMYAFGGKTDCGIINDLWVYDVTGNSWDNLVRATDGESCVRAYDDCTTLCF